jgi:hypothetical protein
MGVAPARLASATSALSSSLNGRTAHQERDGHALGILESGRQVDQHLPGHRYLLGSTVDLGDLRARRHDLVGVGGDPLADLAVGALHLRMV